MPIALLVSPKISSPSKASLTLEFKLLIFDTTSLGREGSPIVDDSYTAYNFVTSGSNRQMSSS
jgi:hypothetical protein